MEAKRLVTYETWHPRKFFLHLFKKKMQQYRKIGSLYRSQMIGNYDATKRQ